MRRREGTRNINLFYLSILAATFTLFCISCAWKKDFRQGQEAFERKDYDQAVAHFLKAVGEKPDSVELRISLANALISASSHYLQIGKQFQEENGLKAALLAFDKALEYNPENNDARRRKHNLLKHLKELEKQQREKTEIQQLKEKAAAEEPPTPQVEYKEKPYSLKFARADLKQIFKALEKTSGVFFIFDESFKSKRISVDFEKVGFMELLDKIMLQTRLFYKVVDPHTIMIIPDTPAKRRDYEELVMRTVFVSNGNPDEILKIVRALTGMKTAAVDKELSSITFKGRPDEVRMAERIARIHDKPKGEVFIDIEIIEVNRTRVREYGIELSQYSITESYLPETGTGTEAAASTIRLHRIGHTDASDYLLTLPSINYKLLKTDRNSRIKARPQLRVVDGQKVEVRLGDKIPIPTTSFVPYNVGAPAQQPITSYQLQEVGINIELTPQIHHDGLISLEMKFELTFITNPGTERIPPTIGNRAVTTIIKLRDNETSILAGLLRDTERKSLRGFPFLSQVPILKEIFSGNTNEIEQTDIILTLTPRIIRFPEIDESDLELLWVGTQSQPGLKSPPVQLELPPEEEETKETEKKTVKKKQTKTVPKTPASQPPPPPTEPQPKPLSMFFLDAGLNIKKDTEADVSLAISGDHDIKAVTLELDFDPSLVQVLDVRKGNVLNQAKVKSLLLRNIDNQAGKLKLNISLEQPLKITPEGTGELMVLRVKPSGKGKVGFKPVLVRVLDAGMKRIEAECTDKGMEFQVSE
jgi:general secretion pathway protein D